MARTLRYGLPLALIVVAAFLAVVFQLHWAVDRNGNINEATLTRIKRGMSLKQVEEIMGRRADNVGIYGEPPTYTIEHIGLLFAGASRGPLHALPYLEGGYHFVRHWGGYNRCLTVETGRWDQVIMARIDPLLVVEEPPSFWDRVLRVVKLR
jgi:hypothetical protein